MFLVGFMMLMKMLSRVRVAGAQERVLSSLVVAPGDGQSFVGRRIPMVLDSKSDVCVAVNETEHCLTSVERLVLENVPIGAHSVRVRSGDRVTTLTLNVETDDDVFAPTYDWREILEDQVPPGLEIRLPVGGDERRTGRIPDPFRLQFFVQRAGIFWRTDVARTATVADLELELDRLLQPFQFPPRRLAYGTTPLHPRATAQDIDLFRHQHLLTIVWDHPTTSSWGSDTTTTLTEATKVPITINHQPVVPT